MLHASLHRLLDLTYGCPYLTHTSQFISFESNNRTWAGVGKVILCAQQHTTNQICCAYPLCPRYSSVTPVGVVLKKTKVLIPKHSCLLNFAVGIVSVSVHNNIVSVYAKINVVATKHGKLSDKRSVSNDFIDPLAGLNSSVP